MCGIVGYFTRGADGPALRQALPSAVATLRHRGPDADGIWEAAPHVGLGHTRLSILDLSPLGHQPMLDASGRFALVFNGEVYNFADVRDRLEGRGHRFRGGSDSEVVLAAFAEWGTRAIDHFIGMFAFAVWDRRDKRLVLIRDRVGVKPLYYAWDGRRLLFASELKALRALGGWEPELDRIAIGEFLQYGYIADPRTVYRGVSKLVPGCWLEASLEAEPTLHRYWSAPEDGLENVHEERLTQELESLMIDAFRLRLVSDVPVGVFLSGGLDSTTVTALLARHGDRPIHTFTIGFRSERFDESSWARRIAAHLGTIHTDRILSPDEMRDMLPRWAELYDEPFGDVSGIPTHLVARVAREDVKVALSADGGDELFGGYRSYSVLPRQLRSLERLPGPVRRLGSDMARVLRTALTPTGGALPQPRFEKLFDRLNKLSQALPDLDPAEYFDLASSYWTVPDVRSLLGDDTDESPRRSLHDYPGSFPETMMRWDLDYHLPGGILTKVDRATMAVSLEGREPLLDHRLVELAYRLPLSLRIGELGTKHILRRVLYRYVPRELVDRPKQGFGVPLREWLRGPLASLIDDLLNERRVAGAGILDPAAVAATVREFRAGSPIDVNRLWFLLAF